VHKSRLWLPSPEVQGSRGSGGGAAMARYVDVSLGAGMHGGKARQPGTFRIQLDNPQAAVYGVNWTKSFGKSTWRLIAPFPASRDALQGWTSGNYNVDKLTGYIQICGTDGALLAELRSVEDGSGPAFALPQGNQFQSQGSWRAAGYCSANVWMGLQFKGGAGLIGGLEGSIGALVNSVRLTNGCSLVSGGWRAGAVGGASGGLALLIATGFKSSRDFHQYKSSGLDWALSFGPKWSGILKGAGKLDRIESFAHGMLDVLDNASRADRLAKLMKNPEATKEIYGVGKSLLSGTLVDDEYQGICAIDIPLLGGGAEIGVYFASATFRTLSEW
jgi:hypothetical protein